MLIITMHTYRDLQGSVPFLVLRIHALKAHSKGIADIVEIPRGDVAKEGLHVPGGVPDDVLVPQGLLLVL